MSLPAPLVELRQPALAQVAAIMRRQRASLNWEPVDRPPLGVWVNRPENRADLVFGDIFDTQQEN